MLQALGEKLSRWAARYVPDPFVLALGLTGLTLVLALISTHLEATRVLWAWLDGSGGGHGFWNLLSFGMQMCLILVTGHALAASPPASRLLNALADRARTPARAIAIVATGAMVLALVNWGLGLIGGALLAREVGQRARRRGVDVHYPLLAAAGYTGLLVWHGGLSGSAPLKVTLHSDLVQVLGARLADRVGTMPLSHTIGSVPNLLVNAALLLLIPWLLVRMQPQKASAAAPQAAKSSGTPPQVPDSPAARVGNSFWLVLAIAGPGVVLLGMALRRRGLGHLDPNLVNFAFLWAGLLLHGSATAYGRAVADAARGCAGIILQFPFYAGIMGILQGSGLLALTAGALARLGPTLLPAAAFYSAGLVNLFVPSGGGQWAVQGPVLMQAAVHAGVEPSRLVMALAYGDQWTNMLQPFWALPLLAITGVKARDIIGYTAVLMLVSQIVFVAGLYV